MCTEKNYPAASEHQSCVPSAYSFSFGNVQRARAVGPLGEKFIIDIKTQVHSFGCLWCLVLAKALLYHAGLWLRFKLPYCRRPPNCQHTQKSIYYTVTRTLFHYFQFCQRHISLQQVHTQRERIRPHKQHCTMMAGCILKRQNRFVGET